MTRKNIQRYYTRKRLLRYICLSFSDTALLHPYEPVGCFKDVPYPRALPVLLKSYNVNEADLTNSLANIIRSCATRAYENGLWYFGVEYLKQCWSGVTSNMTYDRHGRSSNCLWNYGVGSAWTIFVYRFVEG